jgi:carbamoyl-phosphate synthase large subunit/carbamoyl-phosphate synthase small subunit
VTRSKERLLGFTRALVLAVTIQILAPSLLENSTPDLDCVWLLSVSKMEEHSSTLSAAAERFLAQFDVGREARLELSTGEQFKCRAIGHTATHSIDEGVLGHGEVVFVTANVGYVEAMTDPSYAGQILVFTSPLIGNYGVPDYMAKDPATRLPSNVQSLPNVDGTFDTKNGIRVAGVILHECCSAEGYCHYAAIMSFQEWLETSGVWGLTSMDTRYLTQLVRDGTNIIGRAVLELNEKVPASSSRAPSPFSQILSRSRSSSHVATRSRSSSSQEKDDYVLVTQSPNHGRESKAWKSFPTNLDLVNFVSTKFVRRFENSRHQAADCTRTRTLLVFDCGVKVGILKSLLNCSSNECAVKLIVVPFDYDLELNEEKFEFDAILVSNGPGDPQLCTQTVRSLQHAMRQQPPVPILGICLGHQLLALAAGARTRKMPFGHRGTNQPCVDLRTKKCFMTSQNHGYVVVPESLSSEWRPLFENSSDGSNEGIYHALLPFMSVQFHPEGTQRQVSRLLTCANMGFQFLPGSGGPNDTNYIFEDFVKLLYSKTWLEITMSPAASPSPCKDSTSDSGLRPFYPKAGDTILVIGSGGLLIGQAGEFDYTGSQAVKALKEAGMRVILVNPNIATVQTSVEISLTSADKVYCLPIRADSVRDVIIKERPAGLVISMGGQSALNVGLDLHLKGDLEKYDCKVLGTPISSIIATEDRKLFCEALQQMRIPVADHFVVRTVAAARAAVDSLGGYPVLIRAAYALGGLGSGFVHDDVQLERQLGLALGVSETVILDKDLRGWKELEYEIVRDNQDNCVAVCNMENLDPLGVHTGDSIVVAPSQTLNDAEVFMLRDVSLRVIRHFGIVGECNIQYALDPSSSKFVVVEVNARLSRSSALASKATGYPLAYIAMRLLLGHSLPDIKNPINGYTCACFEPALDYIVLKLPRWDTQKFSRVSNELGSSMSSVGEVMAIGASFEEVIQKAVRMVTGGGADGLEANEADIAAWDSTTTSKMEAMEQGLAVPTNARLFTIMTALQLGFSVERIHSLSKINKWFLWKLKRIVHMRNFIISEHLKFMEHEAIGSTSSLFLEQLSVEPIRILKAAGFSDSQISRYSQSSPDIIRAYRVRHGLVPAVKAIDTLAGEYPARTNYLYTTYGGTHHDAGSCGSASHVGTKEGVIVLGCGPYCIGSSVEFDWCAVHCVRELRALQQYRAIVINCNPETVSTDFDESDSLYFEELTVERVLDIFEHEHSKGIIISMGGQTPNNLCTELNKHSSGIVLGTPVTSIEAAEDRFQFSNLLDLLKIHQPVWRQLTSVSEAISAAEMMGYPVLTRPSFILSGTSMRVSTNRDQLLTALREVQLSVPGRSIVISKYILNAKEIEFDAVAHRGRILNYAVSEHVENAGVHSGDATLVLPAQKLYVQTVRVVKRIAATIANALQISGPFNLQLMAKDNDVMVIECNVRASRTFPFVSKVRVSDSIPF